MDIRAVSALRDPVSKDRRAPLNAPSPLVAEAWQVRPIEGAFEVVYEDVRGAWTTRTLDARELKLGPGRTLLGGIDRASGLYRGLRVDRIRRLSEPSSATRLETGILDWLLARAEAQRRARLERERAIRRGGRDAVRDRQAA